MRESMMVSLSHNRLNYNDRLRCNFRWDGDKKKSAIYFTNGETQKRTVYMTNDICQNKLSKFK